MKRLLILLFAVTVVALAQAPIRPAEAAPPGCFCGGYYYTPQLWGQGNSCSEAETSLWAQAMTYVYCANGRCGLERIVTAGCHWDSFSGKFQVDGYIRWRCWECE